MRINELKMSPFWIKIISDIPNNFSLCDKYVCQFGGKFNFDVTSFSNNSFSLSSCLLHDVSIFYKKM